MTSTIENPFAAAYAELRAKSAAPLARKAQEWDSSHSRSAQFFTTGAEGDACGRPDDTWEAWFRDLVMREVVAAQPGDSEEMRKERTSALIGLVSQLDVAVRAGSTVTVEAVINVARAAFTPAYSPDEIAKIGIAGMCVMWVQNQKWFDDNRDAFDHAVNCSHMQYRTYRPDSYLDLAGDLY